MGPGEERARPVWLVTGCSTGIGHEIARRALESGARVAVTARDVTRVEPLVESHPDHSIALDLDVTRPEQVAAAVAETESRFGSCSDAMSTTYRAKLEEAMASIEAWKGVTLDVDFPEE